MEKAEITAGLRSALSRGYSLEFAKKSFINAGYNHTDVEDSAASISRLGGDTKGSLGSSALGPSESVIKASVEAPQTKPSKEDKAVVPNSSIVASVYKPLPRIPSQIQSYQRSTDEAGKPKRKGLVLIVFLILIFLLVLGVLGMLIFARGTVENLLASLGLI